MISRLTCWIALLCTLPVALPAQSTEADLKARLLNKPLYLRGWWRDDTLHFGPTGQLIGASKLITFTICGFDLKKIRIQPDRLILEGRRVGLELADGQQKRIPLQINGYQESIHIEIAASPNGDYGPALNAIFVDNLADLVPTMPFYWKSYAQKNFLPAVATSPATAIDPATAPSASMATAQTQESSLPPATKPLHVAGAIKPPKLLHSAELGMPDYVRELKYGGTTLVNLWVKPDGTVTNMSVVRALGLGLDECALAAVQQYVFAPATENGKPVLVELNIEVNVQFF